MALIPHVTHAAATLRAVREITAPATTRLIVELSGVVGFRLQRTAARPDLGVPARLYVDLLDTQLGDPQRVPGELSEGPLLRLRATQRDAHTTRLILDVPGLSDFGAFPMLDPFRLIVDVRGLARPGPRRVPSPLPPSAPPPAAPPAVVARRSEPAPAALPTMARHRVKIVLDPGHGGKDPGAYGPDAVAEKDVVLAIARRLARSLVALPQVDVVLTRDTDVFLPLEERTGRANAEQADVFVSIHANASPNPDVSGVETYYLNNTNDRATLRLAEMENGLRSVTGTASTDRDAAVILSSLIQTYKVQESVALAEHVQRSLVDGLDTSGTRVNDLGVKRGPFYVLVGAGMPCVLVEVSFLTHPDEGRRLGDSTYQAAIADGLLRGIRRFVENARVTETL